MSEVRTEKKKKKRMKERQKMGNRKVMLGM